MSVLGRIKTCEESYWLTDVFTKYWVGGEIEMWSDCIQLFKIPLGYWYNVKL